MKNDCPVSDPIKTNPTLKPINILDKKTRHKHKSIEKKRNWGLGFDDSLGFS